MCNGEEIEKVDHFGYLGVHFESDGDPLATVKQRTAIAARRFKELGMIWKREDIMTNIKTRLYSSAVLSVLKYGSETWTLTKRVIDHVKSFNARRLTVMTGKSIQTEMTLPTVDVWQSIRRTRYSFLGHILRDDHDRCVHGPSEAGLSTGAFTGAGVSPAHRTKPGINPEVAVKQRQGPKSG